MRLFSFHKEASLQDEHWRPPPHQNERGCGREEDNTLRRQGIIVFSY